MTFGGGVIPEELFNWIRKNLPEGKTILEFGSGEGTKELLKYYTVYSVEHDKKWLNLAEGGNYIYAPIIDYGGYKWYDFMEIEDNLPTSYDLIIVDGPPGYMASHPGRYGFVRHSHLFDMTVPIVLDDTHRDIEQRMAKELMWMYGKKLTEYKSTDKKFTVLI